MSLLQQVQDGPKPKPRRKMEGIQPEDLLDVVLKKLKPEAAPIIEQFDEPPPPAPAPVINTAAPATPTQAAPLEDLLRSVLASNAGKTPTKWTFTIKRNAAGFIESIEANAN